MKTRLYAFMFVMGIVTLSLGCVLPFGGPSATPTPDMTATRTGQPTPTYAPPTPTHTPTAVPTVEPSGLDTQGPWLVFSSADGLQAVNASAEGGLVTLLDNPPAQWTISPRGRNIAVLTADNADLQGLLLSMVDFPGGQARELSILTNGGTEPQPGMGAGDTAFEAARAIAEQSNLAWSPDGYTLAFISALSGDTADLYTYDLRTNQFNRLTTGPSQAFSPSWSPNGAFIAHLGARTFGTGAGYDMDGGWAVRMADRKIFELFTIEKNSEGDEILGWRDGDVMVLRSFESICGWHDLRTYHPTTFATRRLFAESFAASWFAPNGAILVNVEPGMVEMCNQLAVAGLYFFTPDSVQPVQVLPVFNGEVVWVRQLGAFLLLNDGQLSTLGVDGSRTLLLTPYNTLPVISEGGRYWTWALPDGIYNGLFGQQPARIFDGPAHDAIWSPDGSTLFFFGESETLGSGLFRAEFPGFMPQLVAPVAEGKQPAWVLP